MRPLRWTLLAGWLVGFATGCGSSSAPETNLKVPNIPPAERGNSKASHDPPPPSKKPK